MGDKDTDEYRCVHRAKDGRGHTPGGSPGRSCYHSGMALSNKDEKRQAEEVALLSPWFLGVSSRRSRYLRWSST